MSYNLDNLHTDIYCHLFVRESLKNIWALFCVNKKLKINLGDCKEFWKEKFKHDYGNNIIMENIKTNEWKQYYKNHGQIIEIESNKITKIYDLLNKKSYNSVKYEQIYKSLLIVCKKVSVGFDHILVLDYDNYVWVSGRNDYGQLGLEKCDTNNDKYMNKFTKIPAPNKNSNSSNNIDFKAKDISAGHQYSLFIGEDDNLWSVGKNDHGQLGRFGYNVNSFILDKGLIGVKKIYASQDHSLFVRSNGQLYGSGAFERFTNIKNPYLPKNLKCVYAVLVSDIIPKNIIIHPYMTNIIDENDILYYTPTDDAVNHNYECRNLECKLKDIRIITGISSWRINLNDEIYWYLGEDQVNKLVDKNGNIIKGKKIVQHNTINIIILDTNGKLWITHLTQSVKTEYNEKTYSIEKSHPTQTIALPFMEEYKNVRDIYAYGTKLIILL